jgi:hypothetical protein
MGWGEEFYLVKVKDHVLAGDKEFTNQESRNKKKMTADRDTRSKNKDQRKVGDRWVNG